MATSVIDYIFRDLAISYLKRSDLAQVKPEDLEATGTKSDFGVTEGKDHGDKHSAGFRPSATVSAPKAATQSAPIQNAAQPSQQAASGKTVKGQGGSFAGNVTPIDGGVSASNTAKAGVYSTPAHTAVMDGAYPEENEVIKIVNARIKGYEGDPCSLCGSFSLVRNGTCLKCDNCGSTTGCS